jgi:serine/threonine-protein kinase RsbW
MTQTHDLALRPRVPQLSPYVELQGSLASRVADISSFVDRLTRFLKPLVEEFGKEDGSDVEIEIAVREAIANAVIHGNHDNPQKRVYVTCRCSTGRSSDHSAGRGGGL